MRTSNLLFLVSFLFINFSVFAQNGFNYQAIIRDNNGEPVKNETKTINIQLLNKSITGDIVYSEIHNSTTNDFGLINIVIGKGTTSDQFDSIDWSDGPYFLNLSVDGTDMGTTQLLSVPFAMHAEQLKGLDIEKLYQRINYLEQTNKMSYVYDIDSNKYQTIGIGNQTWMAENLRTTRFNDGSAIPYVPDSMEWCEMYFDPPYEAYCFFNNDSNYASKHGYLYNYPAVISPRKICPEGYRVPDTSDFRELFDFLGGDTLAGPKMKKPGLWSEKDYPDGVTNTNESGFNIEIAFDRYPIGDYFYSKKNRHYLWTKDEFTNARSWIIGIFEERGVAIFGRDKCDGLYVRCLKE